MAATKSARAETASSMNQKVMPWVLVTQLYWMSYKLLALRKL
jgi:hypothetical protein